jgi:hypothetical protein
LKGLNGSFLEWIGEDSELRRGFRRVGMGVGLFLDFFLILFGERGGRFLFSLFLKTGFIKLLGFYCWGIVMILSMVYFIIYKESYPKTSIEIF